MNGACVYLCVDKMRAPVKQYMLSHTQTNKQIQLHDVSELVAGALLFYMCIEYYSKIVCERAFFL